MTDVLVVKQRWDVAVAICRMDQVHGFLMNWRRFASCREIRHFEKSGKSVLTNLIIYQQHSYPWTRKYWSCLWFQSRSLVQVSVHFVWTLSKKEVSLVAFNTAPAITHVQLSNISKSCLKQRSYDVQEGDCLLNMLKIFTLVPGEWMN